VLILTGLLNEDYIPKVLQRVMNAISLHPQVLEELEKVLSTVSKPMVLDNREIDITCSIGVSLFPHDTKDTAVLLRNASAAVRRAKDLGHNNVQFFTAELNARMSDRLSLQTMMRRALEREEFELYYQPKINLSDGSISGVEALLRWNSSDRGMVPPVEFIPTLETSGLIIDVGKWILKRAASQYVEWRARLSQAPRIAVNISQLQLAQKNFTTVVEEVVESHGLISDCGLDLEITESLIMQDIDANVSKLKIIRDMGVNISIDDFGTGHSSLSYLTQLPVNALKIDRSFITDMVGSSENLTIVLVIISLAHSLKHKVIAEGIDDQAQMDLLRQYGCDEAQGYLIGHPMPARDFEAWYRRWSLSLKPDRSREV
jgi:EAL domain-containing protein (putative c-di-GMP-specific phosphodiesterase class I)